MDCNTTVEPSNSFTNGHVFKHTNDMRVIFFDTYIYLIYESQPAPLDLLKYVLINNMYPHWPAKKPPKNNMLHHKHLADKWDRGSDWEQPALCSQAVTPPEDGGSSLKNKVNRKKKIESLPIPLFMKTSTGTVWVRSTGEKLTESNDNESSACVCDCVWFKCLSEKQRGDRKDKKTKKWKLNQCTR